MCNTVRLVEMGSAIKFKNCEKCHEFSMNAADMVSMCKRDSRSFVLPRKNKVVTTMVIRPLDDPT